MRGEAARRCTRMDDDARSLLQEGSTPSGRPASLNTGQRLAENAAVQPMMALARASTAIRPMAPSAPCLSYLELPMQKSTSDHPAPGVHSSLPTFPKPLQSYKLPFRRSNALAAARSESIARLGSFISRCGFPFAAWGRRLLSPEKPSLMRPTHGSQDPRRMKHHGPERLA